MEKSDEMTCCRKPLTEAKKPQRSRKPTETVMESAIEWWPNNGWDIDGKGRRGRKVVAKPTFE